MRYRIPSGTFISRYNKITRKWDTLNTIREVIYDESDMLHDSLLGDQVMGHAGDMYFRLPLAAAPYFEIAVGACFVEKIMEYT